MNEIDLYKRVVGDCDEALREAFIRRMNIADKIAEHKLKQGLEITSSQADEIHVQQIVSDVPVELRPMALSLWRSLARMNRGRQYSYFSKKCEKCKLAYEKSLSAELAEGDILCTADIVPVVESRFNRKTKLCPSSKEVVKRLAEGTANLAAVKTNGFYDTSWIYSLILEDDIYINRFEMLNNGSMIVLLSKNLVTEEHNSIITVAFSITMSQTGDMAQKVSVFSEAGLNIEYLTVKTQNIDADDQKNINIVFVELSGGSPTDQEVKSAFLQLENECEYFKILGFRKSV